MTGRNTVEADHYEHVMKHKRERREHISKLLAESWRERVRPGTQWSIGPAGPPRARGARA